VAEVTDVKAGKAQEQQIKVESIAGTTSIDLGAFLELDVAYGIVQMRNGLLMMTQHSREDSCVSRAT
jgi:hypothetical protein